MTVLTYVCVFLLSLFFAVTLPDRAALANPDDNSKLKAAFLLNFVQFTQWAPFQSTSLRAPLTVCLSGSKENEILGEINNKRIADMPTKAIRLTPGSSPDACQVIYLASGVENADACRSAQEAYIANALVVSDGEDRHSCGVHIALVTINNRIRFIVYLEKVNSSKLKLSSQLLELAIIKKGE